MQPYELLKDVSLFHAACEAVGLTHTLSASLAYHVADAHSWAPVGCLIGGTLLVSELGCVGVPIPSSASPNLLHCCRSWQCQCGSCTSGSTGDSLSLVSISGKSSTTHTDGYTLRSKKLDNTTARMPGHSCKRVGTAGQKDRETDKQR